MLITGSGSLQEVKNKEKGLLLEICYLPDIFNKAELYHKMHINYFKYFTSSVKIGNNVDM